MNTDRLTPEPAFMETLAATVAGIAPKEQTEQTQTERILVALDESSKRAEVATEGPWHVEISQYWTNVESRHVTVCQIANEDAPFIAAARTDLPRRDEALRVAVETLGAIQQCLTWGAVEKASVNVDEALTNIADILTK